MRISYLLCFLLAACAGDAPADAPSSGVKTDPFGNDSTLGAHWSTDNTTLTFNVFSSRATRVEVDLYDVALGVDETLAVAMTQVGNNIWSATLDATKLSSAGLGGTIYYGYRAWGPNWTYDPSWTKGSSVGFVADVDAAGTRFNPNKLLFDPYAQELSRDPVNPQQLDGGVYASGAVHRLADSGRAAAKGIVLARDTASIGTKPTRALKDEVIYEVHVRGLSKQDPSIAPDRQGTYAGAADEAAHLASIGVTAVELLPVFEAQNDQNDLAQSTSGANYWGYATLDFFAPDRRYALDQSPGGPTREFRQMVRAFHDQGIKVYLDVVYNHTGEGYLWNGGDPSTANVMSYRGLDNPAYYELTNDNQYYWDDSGTGGNFNTASQPARDLILSSLGYWSQYMGVDGFRFDLASVLGNTCTQGCFNFDKLDPSNVLNRAVRELPGVDLIAEPWAAGGANNYQVGGFPSGWAEWNGQFRDTIRTAQNELGVTNISPGALATRIAGSSDLYQNNGRKPWNSINFIAAHDGFTLRDVYAYGGKNNGQSWPYGPSDGGTDDNKSWDQGGDPSAQRQAARTGMALMMLSAGVPMITGGDEMYRTQYGNNNAYNLDSPANWLDYSNQTTFASFATFAQRMIAFRAAHPSLRPADFFTGTDPDGNGLKDITWYADSGNEADAGYMSDTSNHFLAWRVDAQAAGESVRSIYVAYNGWSGFVTANLPAPAPGMAWYRACDTDAWDEPNSNCTEAGNEDPISGSYAMHPRSLLVLVER